MELTRNQFEILSIFATTNEKYSQRGLVEKSGFALGTVNKTLKKLVDCEYVKDNCITKKGLEALEPYRARRAVFTAAGFGSRMVPITLSTPKPLVRVNGERIIDGLIDACLACGINEIYIVRGYLAENFDMLLTKYPMIKFINNPVYNETNNISSALQVKDYLSNGYLLEADLLIRNPKIIKKYHYTSDFLAIKKERSDDWCFKTKNGYINSLEHGGCDCWQEVGISYWNFEDGKKLSKHIKEAYDMPGGHDLFFEAVPLVKFASEYKVEINECFDEDIVEIDSFNELKQIDRTYDVI